MQRRSSNISDHYVIIARIRDGISNARNKYGDCARILTATQREIKTSKRERPEHFRDLLTVTVLMTESWKSWGGQRGRNMAIGLMQNVNK